MKNAFEKATTKELIDRLNKLTYETQPLWGKMDVARMLAHCNVSYEMAFEDKHQQATGLKRILLKLFVKGAVVSEKPYPKNSRTAPAFLIADERDFETEKSRLMAYIEKTSEVGPDFFEEHPSPSFGPLTAKEWSNLFYKHVDHHLTQFGV